MAEATPTNTDSPSMQFLPRHDEVAGWRLRADPLVYDKKNLVSYLGTEGSQFAPYSPNDLTVGEYDAADGSGYATVEIFRFDDFIHAFGAYSSRKNTAQEYIALGNETFLAKHSINLWSGPFYVRIIAGVPVRSPLALKLAQSVGEKMPKAPSKPAIFAFLPQTGRIPNSEGLSAGPALGQPPLRGGFTALFNIDGELIDAVVVPTPSTAQAARALESFKNFFTQNGKLLDPVPNLGEDNFTAEDRYFGHAVAFRIDRFLFVFRNFGNRQKIVDLAIASDQRVLGTIRKQLQNADETTAR